MDEEIGVGFRRKCQHATILVSVAAMSGTALAQVKFPVPAPTPEIGAIARYRTVDAWNGKELRQSDSELVAIEAGRFLVRFTSPIGTEARTIYFTNEWQPCRSMQDSTQEICAGSLHFPMQIGSKHSYDKLPWSSGQGHGSGDCEVVGEEKITVAAGSFDTAKIECSGYTTRVVGGSFHGRQKEVIWYAPSISRLVKSEYTNFNSANRLNTRETTELTEFIVKARQEAYLRNHHPKEAP